MSASTLQIADRLEAAGSDGRAAEEIALVFPEMLEQQLGRLVTKDYLHGELDRLRAALTGEMAELPGEMDVLRADMATMVQRITNTLTLRLGATIVAGVAVLGGLDIVL